MTDKPIKRSTGPYGWNTIWKNGEKYMTRIWLGRLRVHVFFKGDDDRDPHDHPWAFWTFPLTSYVEEVTVPYTVADYADEHDPAEKGVTPTKYKTRLQVVPAWRWNYRPAEHCHRVIGPYSGKVVLTNEKRATRITDYEISAHDLVATQHVFTNRGYVVEPVADEWNGGKMITIVIRTGFTRMWGFLKTRDGKWCWQDFKSYLNENGGSAPCE